MLGFRDAARALDEGDAGFVAPEAIPLHGALLRPISSDREIR